MTQNHFNPKPWCSGKVSCHCIYGMCSTKCTYVFRTKADMKSFKGTRARVSRITSAFGFNILVSSELLVVVHSDTFNYCKAFCDLNRSQTISVHFGKKQSCLDLKIAEGTFTLPMPPTLLPHVCMSVMVTLLLFPFLYGAQLASSRVISVPPSLTHICTYHTHIQSTDGHGANCSH